MLMLTLAGCADPPGLSKPKPFDLNEENRSTATYNKYKSVVQNTDGVLTTYLTQTNNPRRMIVVVKDEKTAESVKSAFRDKVLTDGLSMKVRVVDRQNDDDPIEAVPTESTPDTWWGRILQFFQGIRAPWQPAK
jgi:hypothetical protein